MGLVSAPQRYVAFARLAFTNVPDVAVHLKMGSTPYNALVVDVSATSLPAACLQGDIV